MRPSCNLQAAEAVGAAHYFRRHRRSPGEENAHHDATPLFLRPTVAFTPLVGCTKRPRARENPTPQERTVSDRPAPPPGLEKVGRTLWADVLDDAPEHATLDARTRSILATACPKPTKTQRSSKHSRMRGSPSAGRPGSGDSMLRRPRLARVAWPSRGCLSRSASTAFSARPITTWRPYRHG
jgi:hypothetical protein